MHISGEDVLITFLLMNALIGAILGLRFSAFVVVPLVAIAILEVAFLTTTWISAFWWGVVLIFSFELGYLVGSAFGAMWRPLSLPRFRRDLTVPQAK
jgi:hypothetical protein